MIKFVSDLREVGVFSPGTPVSSTNTPDRYDITEILLKVALNTINHLLERARLIGIKVVWSVLFVCYSCCVSYHDLSLN